MVLAAIELMRERGSAGVTIDAILSRSEAPRGSVYYHFPGGRNQIIAEALEVASDAISSLIDSAVTDGPLTGLGKMRDFWSSVLISSDFQAGCPVVSVVAGGGEDSEQHADAVTDTFRRWKAALAAGLTAEGIAISRAESLAVLTIAAFEGAIIMCRAERSLRPLEETISELERVLAAALPAAP